MNKVYSTTIGGLFVDLGEKFDSPIASQILELDSILESPHVKRTSYELACYQRDYKWGKETCTSFFNDITEEKENGYNFGFLTFCKTNSDRLEVIDGQQRITTSYILLLALLEAAYFQNSDDDFKRIMQLLVVEDTFQLFSAEQSRTLDTLIALRKAVLLKKSEEFIKQCDISSDGKTVIDAFKLFRKSLSKKIQNESEDNRVNCIRKIFDQIIKKEVVVLKYESSKAALISFITLNMKNVPLNSYEITSALFLEGIDKSNYNDIKSKVSKLYDYYQIFSKKIKGLTTFDDFFRSITIGLNYDHYSKNPKQIDEINLSLTNNYIKNKLNSLTKKNKALIDMLELCEIADQFYNNYSKDFSYRFDSFLSKSAGKKRHNELLFLIYGTKRYSASAPIIDFKNVPAHLNRYIIGLLNDCRKTTDEKRLKYLFTELTLTLIIHHQIVIGDYNYDLSRKGINSNLYSNANELKELYSQKPEGQSFLMTKKMKGLESRYGYVTETTMESLLIIFQIKGKNAFNNPGGKDLLKLPNNSEFNLEHFIIDQSRYQHKSYTRDAYFTNCIPLYTDTNNVWGTKETNGFIETSGDTTFKCLKNKIEYLEKYGVSEKIPNFTLEYSKILKRKLVDDESDYQDLYTSSTVKLDDNFDIVEYNNFFTEKMLEVSVELQTAIDSIIKEFNGN